jgi:hypothetical protein
MELFHRIKSFLHGIYLDRQLSRLDADREVVKLSEAKRIGVLYNASKPDNTIAVTKFAELLRKQGKDVSVLGFVNEQRNDLSQQTELFNKKELNWIQLPNSPKIQQFIDTDFDILINAWIGEQPTLEYIATLSRARYRVGEYSPKKTRCNEMMIDVHERRELNYLVDQIAHYLNVFKPHAEKV